MQQRQTIQKQIVIQTLERLKPIKGHLSIDEIYSEIKEEYASISKTTVYRNVRQLAETGIIMQVMLEDGLERYDLNTHDHYHFTCTGCNTVYDVEIDGLVDFSQFLDKNYDFATEKINLSFTGLCKNCKNEN